MWVTSEGALPGQAGVTFQLHLTVRLQAGLPVFGSDTLILDGTAALTSRITSYNVCYTKLLRTSQNNWRSRNSRRG